MPQKRAPSAKELKADVLVARTNYVLEAELGVVLRHQRPQNLFLPSARFDDESSRKKRLA